LFHDFVNWLQYEMGKPGPDGLSWSNQLWESLNVWNVIEGTHVLTIMFFAGTIWIIDLKMMGLAFRTVPFSRLNDRVLICRRLGARQRGEHGKGDDKPRTHDPAPTQAPNLGC